MNPVNQEYKYEVQNMQGLLQILVFMISRGYRYYCIFALPEKKRERWKQIDQKLIRKYGTDKSKWQRHRNKVYERANFYYIRLDCIGILLHTAGTTTHIENVDDHFIDISQKPMIIRITELTAFELGFTKERKVYVRLSEKTFSGLVYKLRDVVSSKTVEEIKKEFNIINGYPAWAGIIKQKIQLAKLVHKLCAKHQKDLEMKDLRINTKRKVHPVWKL